jgi:hypothetical protein
MRNRPPLHFFTVVARNYLSYAFVLGDSILRYHPDAVFSICLIDDIDKSWRQSIESRGFQAIYPDCLSIDDFRRLAFQYNVTELSTAVKPFVAEFLFGAGAQKIIYLDPDIQCFSRFENVLDELDKNSIVLTPHICSGVPANQFPDERSILGSGVFNLGFIGLRATETSNRFLKWWSSHLLRECVSEPDEGLFVDQKWVDFVPVFFEDVCILRNLGYNVAYWNIHERLLENREGILYEGSSGSRVAFVHFSGITLAKLDSIAKYQARNPLSKAIHQKRYTLETRPDLRETFEAYRDLLMAADFDGFAKLEYGFSRYDNGDPISQLERSLYLNSAAWQTRTRTPFGTGKGSFWESCRKAGLRKTTNIEKVPCGKEIARKHGFYIGIIELTLKCLLRLCGPERYMEFAKYVRHQLLPSNQLFILSEKRIPEMSRELDLQEGLHSSSDELEKRKLEKRNLARDRLSAS